MNSLRSLLTLSTGLESTVSFAVQECNNLLYINEN